VKRYRVILPVDIAGKIYQFGDEAELDFETACKYAFCLIAVEQGENDGGKN
jgi:hypothetical protein